MGRRFFRGFRAVAAGLVCILLAWTPNPGREEGTSGAAEAEQRRLELVRREIERLQSSLSERNRQERTLLGDLHRLDLELELHRRQLQLLDAESIRCRDEIARKTREVAELRARLDRQRNVLAERVRALYVSGPLRFERAVVTAGNPAEIADAYRLAGRIARTDRRTISAFGSDLAGLQSALGFLEEQRSALAALRGQEAARRRDLEGVRNERTQLLSGLHQESESGRRALAEMEETERDLQRLVKALASGDAVRPEWKVGFDRFRGLLPWPAPGRVTVPFGARKNSRFDTLVPHPGIDLEASMGEPIRAVFDGTVAFSDWFKGFGNLVILDHGGGFMTAYGHASERLVTQGDRVVGGETVAKAGDTGSLDGPKLFFEIWRDGKPEDPLLWLSRR
jgi:murein hydrolase activator